MTCPRSLCKLLAGQGVGPRFDPQAWARPGPSDWLGALSFMLLRREALGTQGGWRILGREAGGLGESPALPPACCGSLSFLTCKINSLIHLALRAHLA